MFQLHGLCLLRLCILAHRTHPLTGVAPDVREGAARPTYRRATALHRRGMGIQALPSLVNRSHRKDRPVRNGSTPPHSQKTHRSTARVPLWLMALGWFRRPERDLPHRSEEHTSELQSLMRISYAVF